MMTRQACLALDADDPLAILREQFNLPPDTIYLDGNSLGAQPAASAARAQQVVMQEWGNDLICSWDEEREKNSSLIAHSVVYRPHLREKSKTMEQNFINAKIRNDGAAAQTNHYKHPMRPSCNSKRPFNHC